MSTDSVSSGVVVTYDCGTTSVKAAVIDLAGRVLGSAVRDYSVLRPRPGWVEQDPDALWRAVCEAGREALESVSPVASDSVLACVPVAPWKAIIPLGADGRPLRPAITWIDDRAADVKAELSERLGRSGGPWTSYTAALSGADYWSKLGWFTRSESDVWAHATHVVGMNTYLKWKATGVLATEPSDDFLHAPNRQVAPYYAQALHTLGISPDDPRFPPTVPTTEIVGKVTASASEELGIPAGTPVLNGFGDLAAITLGTGQIGDGGTHMYIGSSSWVVNVAPAGTFPEAPFEFAIDGDRTCIAVGTMSSAGLALDWILQQTYRREREELGSRFWGLLDAEVDAVGGEMGGLIGSHWLNGEPYPIGSDVRAIFLGLSGDHDRRHVVRSVLESICMTHRMSVERLAAAGRLPDAPLRVVGGGATSPVWMQIMADVLGHEVETPRDPRYVGVMGAFYCALVGLGLFPDYDAAAAQFTQQGRVFSPRAEFKQRYEEDFGLYTQLPNMLRSLSPVAR